MEQDIQVGKYTLESLTTGMYSDPKIVYREYIQNSVDSLESAVNDGLIEKDSMRISITISAENSCISIRDNGTGILNSEAKKNLMDVGSSKKRNSSSRGFRGIGRLGGMSYCDTLVFTTSANNESCKTIIIFDCKKLRKLLGPGQNEDLSLSAVLEEITIIETTPEAPEHHYFIVEMFGVSSFSDLLDIDAARSYISQVAPLPYQQKHFIYISQLKDFLKINNYEIEEFPIFVGKTENELAQIYKPNKNRFRSDRNKKKIDEITNITYFDVRINNELFALGWFGNCGWYGYLSDKEISGLRARKGNILIGDSKTLNDIFKETRFNGWVQGEVFVVTDKLVPNARRDDFEQNEAYYQFVSALSNNIAVDISKAIREASQTRNDPSTKVLLEIERKLSEVRNTITEGFNSNVEKDKIVEELTDAAKKLEKIKGKEEIFPQKVDLASKIEQTIEQVSISKNYKINQVNSGIDKKSKHVLKVVANVLSNKLSKFLVDEIIEEIINELNRKQG